MAPPTTRIGRLRMFWLWFSVVYFLWKLQKFLRSIRRCQNDRHLCLQRHPTRPQPSKETFPQFFANPDGLWIRVQSWWATFKPNGVVVISHGLAEHIQRYEHLAHAFHLRGFACYGIDHQGHGLSDGDRCYVRRFDDYVRDLLIACRRVRQDYASVPMFLFGHSMGGLIAAHAACREPPLFDGVILSSPFFSVAPEQDILKSKDKPLTLRILKSVSYYFPKLQLIALRNEVLSHDHKIQYRIANDRLHYDGKIPIRTAEVLSDAGREMVERLCRQIEFPYFLFGGEKDQLCSVSHWKTFHDRTISEDKQFQLFEGLYHECLNEPQPQQQRVIDSICRWIVQRTKAYNQN